MRPSADNSNKAPGRTPGLIPKSPASYEVAFHLNFGSVVAAVPAAHFLKNAGDTPAATVSKCASDAAPGNAAHGCLIKLPLAEAALNIVRRMRGAPVRRFCQGRRSLRACSGLTTRPRLLYAWLSV